MKQKYALGEKVWFIDRTREKIPRPACKLCDGKKKVSVVGKTGKHDCPKCGLISQRLSGWCWVYVVGTSKVCGVLLYSSDKKIEYDLESGDDVPEKELYPSKAKAQAALDAKNKKKKSIKKKK